MQPLVVLDGTPVLKLLEGFRREGLHMAIVVDEYGATQGVVTLADIIEAVAGTLPEVGGELLESAAMLKRSDGSWLVDGSFGIDEFEDRLGIRRAARLANVRHRRRLRAVPPRPFARRRRHVRRPQRPLRDRRHGRPADRQAHLSAARRRGRLNLGSRARRREPCVRELAQDAVLNPLRAPPIDRRDRVAAEQHREVQVVAARETRCAAAPELGLALDELARR